MKSQEQRDGDAVVIVQTLLWLAAVAVLAGVLYAIVSALTRRFTAPLDVVVWVTFWVVCGSAAMAPLGYLYRHRRA